jgi:hypothetical protein
MNKHSPRFPVEMMSKALGVSRGGYYKWLKKNAQDSTLAASDQCLNKEIKAVFAKAVQVIAWRDLQNDEVWRQGWRSH